LSDIDLNVFYKNFDGVYKKRNPHILYRLDSDNEEEYKVMKELFGVYGCINRGMVLARSLVIGRYSVLPYYEELVEDLSCRDSRLINTPKQHKFVSDISEWYPHLAQYTFKTYFNVQELPMNDLGSYVVKGNINSRKHSWNRKMFAKDRASLGTVLAELMDDPLISPQGTCIRRYEKLETYLEGINGLPITNEHRIFVLNKKIVEYGYYWANYALDVEEKAGKLPYLGYIPEAWKLIYKVKGVVDEFCPFYVMDIAKTRSGEWILVELNDAQMSGLATINTGSFYRNLKEMLEDEHKSKETN